MTVTGASSRRTLSARIACAPHPFGFFANFVGDMIRCMLSCAAGRVAGVAFLFAVSAAGQTSSERAKRPPAIVEVANPAAPDSAQPQLSVSDRGLLLSWVERNGQRATLKYADRTARGWSAPKVVASGDD